MRTYTTGSSLAHFPRARRRSKRHKLAAIVDQLSDENYQLCKTYSHEVMNYLVGDEIQDRCITDPLPDITIGRGKYGVNELMAHIGISNNHLHSGYHHLLSSAKGLLDRIVKFQAIIEWFKTEPQEMLKFVLWQRSTYQIHVFQKRWRLSFHYLDPFMRGIHNRFFQNDKALPATLQPITLEEFKTGLTKEITRIEAQEDKTEGTESFLRSLYLLLRKLNEDPSFLTPHLASIPSGWRNLKEWVQTLKLSTYGLKRWASVFRSVLSQVYLSVYEKMINQIHTAKVTELFTIPFTEKEESSLPYKMVSGPKYVIRRENNIKNLELMRTQGYFPLRFKLLEEGWAEAIEVRVIPSRKMRQFIHHPEIKLRTMTILAPRGPARDVDIQLVFQGPREAFIATNHLKKEVDLPQKEIVTVDANRRGKYALVTNLRQPIPDDIMLIGSRWETALEEISRYQSLLESETNEWKKDNYETLLGELHRRKVNLRSTYHQKLVNWVGQLMVNCKARVLLLEDLETHTYGTRGALAKAIESMADDLQLYAREVYAVRLYTETDLLLETINPRNSSSIHVNCGGKLLRDEDNYDIAPCNKCHELVNTHENATDFLYNLFTHGSVHSPESTLNS